MLYLGIDQHHKQITISLRNRKGTVIQQQEVSTRPARARAFPGGGFDVTGEGRLHRSVPFARFQKPTGLGCRVLLCEVRHALNPSESDLVLPSGRQVAIFLSVDRGRTSDSKRTPSCKPGRTNPTQLHAGRGQCRNTS